MVDTFKYKSNPTKHVKDISPLEQLVGKKAIDQYIQNHGGTTEQSKQALRQELEDAAKIVLAYGDRDAFFEGCTTAEQKLERLK